ncbi:MAG TPA: preprotein translocase subunit SecA [Edaphocola sp.]|nr:preprotein translocase subunit SecA [Edaphocola sp.]
MLGFLSKLLGGNKSDKDVKRIEPIVNQVNAFLEQYQSLSNDELRNKTSEFKSRIQKHLEGIDKQIADKKAEAELIEDLHIRDAALNDLDKLTKTKDEHLEEILKEILPEAFAVIKETSKRFSENDEVIATATDFDRYLAGLGRTNFTIEGDQVKYKTTWLAGGVEVTWNMIHYDVQLIGGTILHEGKIAEMATGEGKTLVSTLPVYLNALAGLGVHLVTVNDYLARRDSEWNGPLYEFLGLRVDCIDKHQPNTESRRNAYNSDITYGTNNEFGFDYLRDNMVHRPEEMVQRKHHYAIVDEVDSVLIDDARTPLIISGPVSRGDDQQYQFLKPRIEKLVEAQRLVVNIALKEAKHLIKEGKTDKESGGLQLYRAYKGMPKSTAIIKFLSEEGNRQIMQKAENYFIAENQKNMPKVYEELYFYIDEKQKTVDLTEKGLELITGSGEDPNFFILPDISTELTAIENNNNISDEERAKQKDILLQEYASKTDTIHSVQQLLKAYSLFEKDIEYVVIDDKVKIVDEQTGRIMEGRRYSDGLHQAIEAKENVHIEAATQTFATVTLQNYFRMYHKLAGMTGTAETEAGEFWEIYKLDVVSIPTNRPIVRKDQQDLVYKTKREKYKAVIDEVEAMSSIGRPILVGTTSVEVSELLGRMMQQRKIPHNVLNAKHHAREAQVVAEAGISGAVTIATNMAGRGTDIKLGEGVKEAGGLAIIGTERHESRRVDRQLRGRAGRQGDPGSSQFFVSLEDELMRLFGSEKIASIMDKMGHKEGEVLQHNMITKSIERAQKKVEENNFGIRKRLLEYDDVMNAQRNQVYRRRRNALYGDRIAIDIDNAMYDVADSYIGKLTSNDFKFEDFRLEVMKNLAFEPKITEVQAKDNNGVEQFYQEIKQILSDKMEGMRTAMLPQFIDIKRQSEGKIQFIMIPFSDGVKGIQVQVGLDEAIEKEVKTVPLALEKAITLALIDESWKDHLRAMDDLRTSVQMASYEQKDPLLIYKFEAFQLFKSMLIETNTNIVSFLLRAGIPMQEGPTEPVQQIPQQYTDFEELQTNSAEVEARGEAYAANEDDYYDEQHVVDSQRPAPRQKPITVEPKIGRNDPCPCGSGKKYKNCHGR